MKKKLLLFFIILCGSLIINAQNLVPNPSFEIYDTCPNSTNQVYRATGWNIDINSSDYYNSCATYYSMVAVPNTGSGYQCPANGNAYCGFTAYRKIQGQYREYFGRAISNPLNIGQKYFISFKLSLAEGISNCAINNLGIKFSNVNYGDTTLLPVPIPVMDNTASFYTNVIISDSLYWTTISGTYIADSSYQYILIGNFFDNNNTDTSLFFGTWCQSYYFIDDICVSADSLTCVIPNESNVCDSGVNIFEKNPVKESITIFPNPTQGKIFIKTNNINYFSCLVFNMVGILIKTSNEPIIDLTELPIGLYYLHMRLDDEITIRKIALIK